MLYTYLDKMRTKFRKVHFEFFVHIMARDRVKRKPIIATKQVITKDYGVWAKSIEGQYALAPMLCFV